MNTWELCVHWQKRSFQRIRLLSWPEKVLGSLWLIAFISALALPTPVLLNKETLTTQRAHGHWPVHLDFYSHGYGCISWKDSNGTAVGPVCNRSLYCLDSYPSDPEKRSRGAGFYFLDREGAYYVRFGSTCDSWCCDLRGVLFSPDGKRLADGLADRIALRLGLPGALLLALALAVMILRICGCRSLTLLSVSRICVAFALLIFCHNLDPYHPSGGVLSFWWW